MSSEKKYINSNYEDFFEKSLSKSDPELIKAINEQSKKKSADTISNYKINKLKNE